MLARLGRGDGDLGVGDVGGGDVDHVDAGIADDLAPIRRPTLAADDLGSGLGELGRRVGDDFQHRHRRLAPEVNGHSAAGLGVRLAHPADADQPDVNLRHDVPLNVAHRRRR